MSLPPSTVEFRHAGKRYGDGPQVLDDFSLTASPADFISLIGPSGCGKSTLLRLISGLSPLTSGELLVDGHPPELAARELAYVFQEPTLLPWLTVSRNVETVMRLRGVPAAERKATRDRILSLVRLDNLHNRYPRQLSGGQKMRVSLARALTLAPRLLLLDEPFGALDEMTRDHLNEELLAIREQQRWTTFFVTHSVAEAVFLSNRVIVMANNPGQIHREIPVPFPYPRTEDTRQSSDYHRLVAEVSALLRSVERTSA